MPDHVPHTALVLSGGGARAAYQVGVLSAIGEFLPDLRFSILTGVSAGAINTVSLAAHPGNLAAATAGLAASWRRLTADQVYAVQRWLVLGGVTRFMRHVVTGKRTGDPAVRGLLSMDPLRTFLGTAVDLAGIGTNIERGALRAVALSATSYTSGNTVTFVECGPDVPMWSRAQRLGIRTRLEMDHVLASSAIPIVFPALRIGGEYFGDGSVRQAAPLAPAIHLGARRVLAIGMRAARPEAVAASSNGDYPSSAEVFGLLLNSVFLDSLDVDSERLDRINRLVGVLPPDADVPASLQRVNLMVVRPSRDLGAMASPYEVNLPWTMSLLVRAMGGRRKRGSDFVSYLLFDPSYADALMDLGYEDTRARRDEMERFFSGETG